MTILSLKENPDVYVWPYMYELLARRPPAQMDREMGITVQQERNHSKQKTTNIVLFRNNQHTTLI